MSEHLRALALSATPIDPDLYGDRYFGGDYSRADLTKEQDAFVRAANPAAILELLDELADHERAYALLFKENAELRKDADRYRWLRNKANPDDGVPAVTDERCNDWGKWYHIYPSGEELDAAIDSAAKGESNE